MSLYAEAVRFPLSDIKRPGPVPAWQCHSAQGEVHQDMVCHMDEAPQEPDGVNWNADRAPDLFTLR